MQGIFIKTITTGSVADEDGRLKVGDQILKVRLNTLFWWIHLQDELK